MTTKKTNWAILIVKELPQLALFVLGFFFSLVPGLNYLLKPLELIPDEEEEYPEIPDYRTMEEHECMLFCESKRGMAIHLTNDEAPTHSSETLCEPAFGGFFAQPHNVPENVHRKDRADRENCLKGVTP